MPSAFAAVSAPLLVVGCRCRVHLLAQPSAREYDATVLDCLLLAALQCACMACTAQRSMVHDTQACTSSASIACVQATTDIVLSSYHVYPGKMLLHSL